jgi:hypothetical protein
MVDMFDLPAHTIERVEEILPTLFYGLMGLALFLALLGATGAGLFLLILGSAVHVARVGVEARPRATGGSHFRAERGRSSEAS